MESTSFRQRALGQSMYVSEVIAAIHGVPGVSYVDLNQLAGVPQPTDPTQLQNLMATDGGGDVIPQDVIAHHARVDPAQLPPVSDIPDLEIILLAVCHDEPTVP